MDRSTEGPGEWVSVIIPARNEAPRIAAVIAAVRAQDALGNQVEILVADDGSTDDTADEARRAGGVVIPLGGNGNPAVARNLGAHAARGSTLIFLDADCSPLPGWLAAHLRAQAQGHPIVGGALSLPAGLGWTARADYFASAYHVHPGRKGGPVPNHTPANLSVAREVFASTSGFTERFPVADGHEELGWQGEAKAAGQVPWLEPRAAVEHLNRTGLGNLLRRSYRWGYSAIEAKSTSGASRVRAWFRFPLLGILGAYPVALIETGYITVTWILAGRWEAVQFLPVILLSRIVYATAMVIGGLRWLFRPRGYPGVRPQWR